MFVRGFFLFNFIGHISILFSGLPSFSSLILPFPLYCSPLCFMIFRPCYPGAVPGTWFGMILDRFYRFPLSPHPVKCSSGLQICAEGVGSRVIRATIIWTEAIPYNYWTGVERGHSLKFTLNYFWNYFEPILNLFWINGIFLWSDRVGIIFK